MLSPMELASLQDDDAQEVSTREPGRDDEPAADAAASSRRETEMPTVEEEKGETEEVAGAS